LNDEWEFDEVDNVKDNPPHLEEEIADDGDDVGGAEFQAMVRDNWLEFVSRA
jgi:hypothetical protein